MNALFVLGLLACASAAPHYYPHFEHHHEDQSLLDHHFRDGYFDAAGFWGGLEAEMARLEDMLRDFSKQFPSFEATEGIVGNEYVINIPLTGFDVKDIVVKAREGLCMVQAVHRNEDGSQKSYMDLRTLSANVNPAGNWFYEKENLKIIFPLIKKPDSTEVSTEIDNATTAPEVSREEMEPNNVDPNMDADVGLKTEDKDKNTEIFTNEIPKEKVEATTYAVDLKGEVEFVPVSRY